MKKRGVGKRGKVLTDEQRLERKRKTMRSTNAQIRRDTYKGVHDKGNHFDVKCLKCGRIHKHIADIKWKNCKNCKAELQGIDGEEYPLSL